MTKFESRNLLILIVAFMIGLFASMLFSNSETVRVSKPMTLSKSEIDTVNNAFQQRVDKATDLQCKLRLAYDGINRDKFAKWSKGNNVTKNIVYCRLNISYGESDLGTSFNYSIKRDGERFSLSVTKGNLSYYLVDDDGDGFVDILGSFRNKLYSDGYYHVEHPTAENIHEFQDYYEFSTKFLPNS